ncbi:MAG: hypothetical protein ACI3YL_01220 [Prevotella sp.]
MQIESKKASLLDFFAECSLSYLKIMQIESKKASLLDFFAECSLSYLKIMQIESKKGKLALPKVSPSSLWV